MTREDILLNSIWTSGKMNVHSPFFQQEIRIDLYTSSYNLTHTKTIISKKMVDTVNDFLLLSVEYKPLMQKLLYQHCLSCCENISYGFSPKDGETEMQANLREFGVKDAPSAFAKAQLDHVIIEEDPMRTNRFVKLVFYPEWEQEHGCELILKNGVLLDHYGECDTYLGQFDYDK